MKKAALIVGARPQFIKTAPLIRELGRFFEVVLIHTGQHYDFLMSETFFGELAIPEPDYHLEASGGTPGRQIGRMIEGLEAVLMFEKPDLVIVVGDTNSTLAGAVAGARLALPLAHVEAGVRARDKNLPEQINRVITDSVSDYFLCPTPSSVDNLAREGKKDHIYDTGDAIYDCLRLFENMIPEIPASIPDLPREFAVATIHRAEAVDIEGNLRCLLRSLGSSGIPVIFPVHPRTRKRVQSFGLAGEVPSNVTLLDPVGYLDILSLIRRSGFVITDSGGVQREAIYLGKPVILARPETEWLELEKSGWLKISGYSFDLSQKPDFPAQRSAELERLMRPAVGQIAGILGRLLS